MLDLDGADGIIAGEERLCTPVLLGVRPDGTEAVVALEDGHRQSAESWRAVLRDLTARRLRASVLAVGDGALGCRAAVREVWPETAEPPCGVHRLVNALDKLPGSLQPQARRALHGIMAADSRAAAERGIAPFAQESGARYPRAVASLTAAQARVPTYFDDHPKRRPRLHRRSWRLTVVKSSGSGDGTRRRHGT